LTRKREREREREKRREEKINKTQKLSCPPMLWAERVLCEFYFFSLPARAPPKKGMRSIDPTLASPVGPRRREADEKKGIDTSRPSRGAAGFYLFLLLLKKKGRSTQKSKE
jgi:hypothetical protein